MLRILGLILRVVLMALIVLAGILAENSVIIFIYGTLLGFDITLFILDLHDYFLLKKRNQNKEIKND